MGYKLKVVRLVILILDCIPIPDLTPKLSAFQLISTSGDQKTRVCAAHSFFCSYGKASHGNRNVFMICGPASLHPIAGHHLPFFHSTLLNSLQRLLCLMICPKKLPKVWFELSKDPLVYYSNKILPKPQGVKGSTSSLVTKLLLSIGSHAYTLHLIPSRYTRSWRTKYRRPITYLLL